jgi:LPXTG-site transpeptidase (sortase) family protein
VSRPPDRRTRPRRGRARKPAEHTAGFRRDRQAALKVAHGAAAVVCALLALTFLPPVRAFFAGTQGPPPVATSTVEATVSVEPTRSRETTPIPPPPAYEAPARLVIQKLDVDAKVEPVGVDKNGVMVAPKQPMGAAWYKLGPDPGEVGSAVIAGHSGYAGGRAALFDHLDTLKPGDSVTVIDKAGASIAFVVRESRIFDPKADTSEVFGRLDGQHLNLVTCAGSWNAKSGTHSKRLVVFTDAVSTGR